MKKEQTTATEKKGYCSLCKTTQDVIDVSILSEDAKERIHEDNPDWEAKGMICRECADFYENQ